MGKMLLKIWLKLYIQSETFCLLKMHIKLLQKEQFKKKAKANGYLIGNKIADKITKVSRTPLHNSSETITNETENTGPYSEIPKKRQQIIYDLRLI